MIVTVITAAATAIVVVVLLVTVAAGTGVAAAAVQLIQKAGIQLESSTAGHAASSRITAAAVIGIVVVIGETAGTSAAGTRANGSNDATAAGRQ